MTPEKLTAWVELYGNAREGRMLALVSRDDRAARNFEETAALALAELEQLRADHNQALRLLTDIVTESDPYDHGEQPVGWICSIRPMVDAKSWLTERGLLAGVPSQQCPWGCGCRPCGDSRDAATRHHEKLAATATDTEDPGTLTGGQLCGGSGQLFNRPCPGCPDCAAAVARDLAEVLTSAMAKELDMPHLAELPETGGNYGDWLGRDGQCDAWWDARVSKFVNWPRHLKAGAPRISGIMRCVMALGHEQCHNFGGLGPFTPGMPATQLQPDGTYEPVPAGPPLPRCPHCLQHAEPGHEERCQP